MVGVSKSDLLFLSSTGLLLSGIAGWLLEAKTFATIVWAAASLLGLALSVTWTVMALRRHQPSVDVIAVLALAGALAVGEAFAGAMIAVMLASGRLLEARAAARARRDLSLLSARAPQRARRRVGDLVVEIPVADVEPGDVLLVGAGEIVPVDGRLLCSAVLDESALTGEARPRERIAGEDVRSGVVNTGQAVELVATATAALQSPHSVRVVQVNTSAVVGPALATGSSVTSGAPSRRTATLCVVGSAAVASARNTITTVSLPATKRSPTPPMPWVTMTLLINDPLAAADCGSANPSTRVNTMSARTKTVILSFSLFTRRPASRSYHEHPMR